MAFSLLLIASLSKLDNRFAKPVLRSVSTTERVGSFITVGMIWPAYGQTKQIMHFLTVKKLKIKNEEAVISD